MERDRSEESEWIRSVVDTPREEKCRAEHVALLTVLGYRVSDGRLARPTQAIQPKDRAVVGAGMGDPFMDPVQELEAGALEAAPAMLVGTRIEACRIDRSECVAKESFLG